MANMSFGFGRFSHHNEMKTHRSSKYKIHLCTWACVANLLLDGASAAGREERTKDMIADVCIPQSKRVSFLAFTSLVVDKAVQEKARIIKTISRQGQNTWLVRIIRLPSPASCGQGRGYEGEYECDSEKHFFGLTKE
jgi:hypothetical protein